MLRQLSWLTFLVQVHVLKSWASMIDAYKAIERYISKFDKHLFIVFPMQVQSLVNKVCPENMNTIVEKISTVEAPQRDWWMQCFLCRTAESWYIIRKEDSLTDICWVWWPKCPDIAKARHKVWCHRWKDVLSWKSSLNWFSRRRWRNLTTVSCLLWVERAGACIDIYVCILCWREVFIRFFVEKLGPWRVADTSYGVS